MISLVSIRFDMSVFVTFFEFFGLKKPSFCLKKGWFKELYLKIKWETSYQKVGSPSSRLLTFHHFLPLYRRHK